MKHYTFAVFLCSLGVDSVASIREFFERFTEISFDYGFIVVNRTPLSHESLEDYAKLLLDRVNRRYDASLKLIITEPDSWNLHKPPACRWLYKQNPTRRFLSSFKSGVIVTGQRKREGVLRKKLGFEGELYGKQVLRPVFDKSKEYCFQKAILLLPELKDVWRKLYIETGHTSLDCMTCLRRL